MPYSHRPSAIPSGFAGWSPPDTPTSSSSSDLGPGGIAAIIFGISSGLLLLLFLFIYQKGWNMPPWTAADLFGTWQPGGRWERRVVRDPVASEGATTTRREDYEGSEWEDIELR